VVSATAVALTLALASPAGAHAEVEASEPQALAENVVLTFTCEAESSSAGFTDVRVILPEGIAPADITLDEAPEGWKLTATEDGYTVAGPKLAVGTDAVHKVTVRQLPDAESLAFKTIDTYSDGEVSRWIELPNGGQELEQPAPVLELQAAAPGAEPLAPSPSATPTPTSTPTPTPSASTEEPAPSASAASATDDEGDDGSVAVPVTVGVVAAVPVAGGGLLWSRRRRGTSSDS
jgi:uncharacterized protein YcnI